MIKDRIIIKISNTINNKNILFKKHKIKKNIKKM